MTKEESLAYLDSLKNIYNSAYMYGEHILKNKWGKKVLFIQSTTGSAIIDTANNETLDVQAVGVATDTLVGFVASYIPGGFFINLTATAMGYSGGDIVKDIYKNIKADAKNQFYTYHKDYSVLVGGSIVTYEYAKILRDKNGDAIFDNALRAPVVRKITENEYQQHTNLTKSLTNFLQSTDCPIKVQYLNNTMKVTDEQGNSYLTPLNTKVQAELFGGDGNDTYIIPSDVKEVTIADSDGIGSVYLDGIKLTGGYKNTLSSKGNEFIQLVRDAGEIKYRLDGDVLDISHGQTHIKINNYNKSKDTLNISLRDYPGSESAFVIDLTGSMGDDIAAAKESAKTMASNIFNENAYSSVELVTFSDDDWNNLRTFNDAASFNAAINALKLQNGSTELVMHAVNVALNGFNPASPLRKEVYVMTDESGDDLRMKDDVINKALDLNAHISGLLARTAKEATKVGAKINIIALRDNWGDFSALKELAAATGGQYYSISDTNELKTLLVDVSKFGTDSDDEITGTDADNVINGYGGDDILKGGAGSDTYIFSGKNFGNDTIIEQANENDTNSIKISDYGFSDVRFIKDGGDLLLRIDEANSVRVKDFYVQKHLIDSLELKDATLDEYAIKQVVNMQAGKTVAFSDGDYKASWLSASFVIASGEISGSAKDDVLIGKSSDDSIYGGWGNDTLIGSKGDDFLSGGLGNDIYVYTRGDGNDVIYDAGGQDALKLFGYSGADISLTRDDKDLLINLNDGAQIRVQDHFKNFFGFHFQLNSIELDAAHDHKTIALSGITDLATLNEQLAV